MRKNNAIQIFLYFPIKIVDKILKNGRSQKENIKNTKILTSENFYYLSFHEFPAKKLLVGFYYFSVIQKAISFAGDN